MPRWTSPDCAPLEDMRIPLEGPADLERVDSFVWRAREMELGAITFVIADSAPAPLVPSVVAAAKRLQTGRSPRIDVAVEGHITSDEGHISVPALPAGVHHLYVTLDRLPMGMVCVSPLELRESFEEGRTSAMSIVRRSVDVLQAAMRRNRGVVLSRPFGLLAATGIPEEWVSEEALLALAREAAATGASLQVDEWERTPRATAANVFASAGVSVSFGTGAREPEDVGVYDYVGRLIRRVPRLARSARPVNDTTLFGTSIAATPA